MSIHSDSPPRPAASIARKSTADDPGLKAQHLINAQKAAKDGYFIPDDPAFRFEDDDTSGRLTTRDDLDRLVAIVTGGHAPFERVYIKDMTREGRFADPRFHFYLQVLFELHGVKICYSDRDVQLDFGEETDPRDMFGLFLRDTIEAITSSEELSRLIKRVTEGARTWATRGFYPGGKAPYGTERWYADEKTGDLLGRVNEGAVVRQKGRRFKLRFREGIEREVVKQIFDAVELGHSLASTARRLNEQGVPAPEGGDWYPEAVRRVARNPLYSGALVWGRTTREGNAIPADEVEIAGSDPILFEGFIADPPISREKFARVQTALAGNIEAHDRRRRNSPEYPLSGLITCGVCGATWHGHTRPAGVLTPARGYYRHGNTPRDYARPCDLQNRYLRADIVEPAIEGLVTALLENETLVQLTERALKDLIKEARTEKHFERADRLRASIESLTGKLGRLVNDRAEAETKEERLECQNAITATNKQITSLTRRLEVHDEAVERAQRLRDSTGRASVRAARLRDLYGEASPLERRAVLTLLIRRIRVGSDLKDADVEIEPF